MDDRVLEHKEKLLHSIWSLPGSLVAYLGCQETYSANFPGAQGAGFSGKYVGLCGHDGLSKDITYNDISINEEGNACFGVYVTLERDSGTCPKRSFLFACKMRINRESMIFTVLDEPFEMPFENDESQKLVPAFDYMKSLLLESLSYDPLVGGKQKQRIGFLQ
jgi:hypothetical protein